MPVNCVGKWKGYGFRMLNPKHSPIAWQYCKKRFPEDICESLKNYQRAPMNMKLLYEALKKYDVTPPPKSGDVHMDASEAWCREKFVPKEKLPLTAIEDLRATDLPQGTNPGYPYTVQGYKTKGDAWDAAHADACEILDVYIKGGRVEFPPALAFCRSKVVERDNPKIRFIFGVSLQVLILQMIFFQPLWKYQLAGNTPAAYKNTVFHGGYDLLLEEMYSNRMSVEFGATAIMSDFQNYDTKCGFWLTRRIYDIIHDCLDFSVFSDGYYNDHVDAYERLFFDLMRHDIDTTILMPDGYLWNKKNGDSTGSRAFQIMQNIRTCFINQAVHHYMYGRLAPFMKSLGDDCIWADYLSVPFDFHKANEYVIAKFGPNYNVDKCSQATNNRQLSFLGRDFWGRGSTRNILEVLLSILYPENEEDNYILFLQRVISMYYENANGNGKVVCLLKELYESVPKDIRLYCKTHKMDVYWSRVQLKKFERLGLSDPPSLYFPSCLFLQSLCYDPVDKVNKDRFLRYHDQPLWI